MGPPPQVVLRHTTSYATDYVEWETDDIRITHDEAWYGNPPFSTRDTWRTWPAWSGSGSTLYEVGEAVPLETFGVLLGHGTTEINITNHYTTSLGSQSSSGTTTRELIQSRLWALEDETIIVPVTVIAVVPEGGASQMSLRQAQLLFDDRPATTVQRFAQPGGTLTGINVIANTSLERVNTALSSDPSRMQDPNMEIYAVQGMIRPDDIFVQCGIQFRLVEYVEVEVPVNVYEARASVNRLPSGGSCFEGDVQWNDWCIREYPLYPTGGVDICGDSGVQGRFNMFTALAAQVPHGDVLLEEPVVDPNDPLMPALLPGTLKVTFTGEARRSDCSTHPNGLASEGSWAMVRYGAPAPVLAHELGHVFGAGHYSNFSEECPGMLMCESAVGRRIAGCGSWERQAFSDAYNCHPHAADPMSGFGATCAELRGRAASLANSGPLLGSRIGSMEPPDSVEARPDWLFGDWGNTEPAAFTDERSTEGAWSIQAPPGVTHITSRAFKTAEWQQVGDKLELDVYVPENVPNPFWVGSIGLYFENPATETYQYLGVSELTPLPLGEWSTLEFQVPEHVRQVFLGDHPAGRIRIEANSGSGASDEPLLVDHLRFAGELEQRSIQHRIGSQGVLVATSNLLSFENAAEWTSQQTAVSHTAEHVMDGLHALKVPASGWTVVESRLFDTAELSGVSSQMSIDVYVPDPQPNPWWVGDLHLRLTCPSADVYDAFIGQRSLTNLFDGEFNQLSFDLSDTVAGVLSSSHTDCWWSIVLNVNNGSGDFVFDRFGFL